MGKTPAGQTRTQVFQFVQERLLAGVPPTVREVQEALGFRAVETARAHLDALVSDGRLVKQPGKARGFALGKGQGPGPLTLVPLLGRVQAGALTTAVEEPLGYVAVAGHGEASELFALQVRGLSMRDAGILPGDVVVVRRQATARSGDTVVALHHDEATVKRFHRQGARIELRPCNPAFASVWLRANELTLLGKVIEVRRHLEQAP